MSQISTHVLDLENGRPASGIEVKLAVRNRHGEWRDRGQGVTDPDGRVAGLSESNGMEAAVYRLRFEVGDYFAARGAKSFHPHIDIVFEVTDPATSYHVPLLLSPWGYTTYRGS